LVLTAPVALAQLYGRIQTDPAFPLAAQQAYLLATVAHECAGTWLPIVERGLRSYFDKYDRPPLAAALGNTKPGQGYLYRGRGYVQLTGYDNYLRFSQVLHIDLVSNPDRALEPGIAYQIMSIGMARGLFTGKPLSAYVNGSRTDFLNARRVINGLDKASLIAAQATEFLLAIEPPIRLV
jgi:putative chitinase